MKKLTTKLSKPPLRANAVVGLVLITAAWATPAHAYLDPGTGSILIQGLIATVAAALAASGIFWYRVKAFFSSLFSSEKSDLAEPEKEQ